MKDTTYILAGGHIGSELIQENFDSSAIAITSAGFVKETNEDVVGIKKGDDSSFVFCVSDGHWGVEAAEQIVTHLISDSRPPLISRELALEHVTLIEKLVTQKYDQSVHDEQVDFTPEASFVYAYIQGDTLYAVSYGDSCLLVARNGVCVHTQERLPTWLGVFSHKGWRGRLPVVEALRFAAIQLQDNDYVCLFSDGVNECIYEKETIPLKDIAVYTLLGDVSLVRNEIVRNVQSHGAEDNFSAVIYVHTNTRKV